MLPQMPVFKVHHQDHTKWHEGSGLPFELQGVGLNAIPIQNKALTVLPQR